jgi:Protein of unknown function (DUF3575)
MRNLARFVSVGLLVVVPATHARAQDEGTTTPVARNQVISASPFLLMFKWFNVDYERRVSPSVTLGASGSYLPVDGFDYGRATLHARYYPQGAALTGFYMGGQTGIHRAGTKRDHGVFFGAGVDVGYAWLLGAKRNHAFSVGLGTTRLFGRDLDGYALMIPNARLVNIGFAF